MGEVGFSQPSSEKPGEGGRMSSLGEVPLLVFVDAQRAAAPLTRRFGFASASTSPTRGEVGRRLLTSPSMGEVGLRSRSGEGGGMSCPGEAFGDPLTEPIRIGDRS